MKKLILIFLIVIGFTTKGQTNKALKIELANVDNDTILPNVLYRIKPILGYKKVSFAGSGSGISISKIENIYYLTVTGYRDVMLTLIVKGKVVGTPKKFYVKN